VLSNSRGPETLIDLIDAFGPHARAARDESFEDPPPADAGRLTSLLAQAKRYREM
jgi:hypothetical protein